MSPFLLWILIQLYHLYYQNRSGKFEKLGYGMGPIWISDLACAGNETTIEDCPRTPWGLNNCNHFHDIGVTCYTG